MTINHLFEDDKTFEPLASGLIQHASSTSPQMNPVQPISYHQERQVSLWEQVQNWFKALPWMNIIIGLVAGFFALIILPVVIGRILRSK